MKAVILEEPKRLAIHQIAEPEAPGPDEALVRVHRVGICGTDIAGYLGKFPFYGYPRIPGHELGVEVLEVGSQVSHIRPGDRCAVEPYINDPNSFASRRGSSNCCERLQVLGVHVDGGMRPRFKVPARKLHPSSRLGLDQLALVETLSIGCHAVNRAAPQPGEKGLVIGAGPIGLSVIEFAKLAEVDLIVMDMNPRRLEFCRQSMGVRHTVTFQDEAGAVDALRDLTDGNLPTVVWDATGSAQSMSSALQYVAHTGRLVYVGIVTDRISFADPLFHSREITLLASRNSLPADFRRIIGLIEEGRIDTRPWITHHTSMDRLIGDFDGLIRPETGTIKAVVEIDPAL